MPQQPDSDFVLRRIREDVTRALDETTKAISPDRFGRDLCDGMDMTQRASFASFAVVLLEQAYVEEVRRQTKNQPADSEQIEAFPLDSWISATVQGERIRYRHATWGDHQAHRARQIANVERISRAFDREEERREQLRTAGMADDPTMTTEQAVRVLDSTAVAAD